MDAKKVSLGSRENRRVAQGIVIGVDNVVKRQGGGSGHPLLCHSCVVVQKSSHGVQNEKFIFSNG